VAKRLGNQIVEYKCSPLAKDSVRFGAAAWTIVGEPRAIGDSDQEKLGSKRLQGARESLWGGKEERGDGLEGGGGNLKVAVNQPEKKEDLGGVSFRGSA